MKPGFVCISGSQPGMRPDILGAPERDKIETVFSY